jgi:hypothetical protein
MPNWVLHWRASTMDVYIPIEQLPPIPNFSPRSRMAAVPPKHRSRISANNLAEGLFRHLRRCLGRFPGCVDPLHSEQVLGCFVFACEQAHARGLQNASEYLLSDFQQNRWTVPTFPSSLTVGRGLGHDGCLWTVCFDCLHVLLKGKIAAPPPAGPGGVLNPTLLT